MSNVSAPPARAGAAAEVAATAVPEPTRRSGPACAAVLAAGLGSLTLGVLSVLTAASSSVSSALIFSDRVGNLSGVTTIAAIVFFVSWAALAVAWRDADPPLLGVAAGAGVLVALGLLGTFPPFFNAIGS